MEHNSGDGTAGADGEESADIAVQPRAQPGDLLDAVSLLELQTKGREDFTITGAG